jgi:hypothetical protein
VFGGTTIHFRVGGGCSIGGDYWNPLTEHIGGGVYVELLVDGYSVIKTTGRCTESMHRESWDVRKYKGRTGQIRVVDASSANWGHINFDEVRFDWDVVPERTANAGAAYTFRRHLANSNEPCTGNSQFWPHAHLCHFELQAKLQASDKRADDMFGYSVAVDDATGVAVVGAKHQVALDAKKLPVRMKPELGDVVKSRAGAVYLFRRVAEARDGLGTLLQTPYWPSYEQARLQPPDGAARDEFGASVAISGFTVFAGATGDDGKGIDGGAAYQQDVELVRLSFRQKVFPGIENNLNGRIEVAVARAGPTTTTVVVHYATSDITAVGVDAETFSRCQRIPISQRGDACGDYQLTAGDLVINAGLRSKSFFVPVMDNGCYEHPMEYLQVTLSVPGGNAILGEDYTATVRIDDDDSLADPCV